MDQLNLKVKYLEEKHFNRSLEKFYYGLSKEECKIIEKRMIKTMVKYYLNDELFGLYLGEINIIRKLIKHKENERIKDIRQRYGNKSKRKFI